MMNVMYSKLIVLCMFVSAMCISGNNTYDKKEIKVPYMQLRRNQFVECCSACPHVKKGILHNITKTKSS